MRSKIAIEIGTSYTKIYKARQGVVLYEPTVIAIEKSNYKKPLAVGYEAEKLQGKSGENVKIIHPVDNTEIINVKALTSLLLEFLNKIKLKNEKFFEVLLIVQCGSDGEVISHFENALNSVGLYNISFAENPILSLLGAEAPLTDTSCHAVIDLGGGQTTVCALNLNGVISGVSAGIGGNKLNSMIISHVEDELNLTLTNQEVENLKISIASLVDDDDTKTIVQGKQTSTGKPRSLNISASQISKPIKEYIQKTANIANLVLSKLNSDCIKEINKNGIYLTGGGSNLYGIEDYFSQILGFKVIIPTDSKLSSILGASKLLADKNLLEKIKLV